MCTCTGWDRHPEAEIDTKPSCLGNYTLPAFSPQAVFQWLSHKGRNKDKWVLLLKIPVLKRTSLLDGIHCVSVYSSLAHMIIYSCRNGSQLHPVLGLSHFCWHCWRSFTRRNELCTSLMGLPELHLPTAAPSAITAFTAAHLKSQWVSDSALACTLCLFKSCNILGCL